MEDIVTFNTVADLYQVIGLPISVGADFTIHRLQDLHRNYPVKSPLFRANYYSIVLILKGRGDYILDSKTYEMRQDIMYFNNPGHVKGFEFLEEPDGYLITLSEIFLKKNIGSEVLSEFPFLIEETVPPSDLNQEQLEFYKKIFSDILYEFKQTGPYKFKVLGNLISILLLRIKEHFWDEYNPEISNRSSRIVSDFKENLERHFRELVEQKATVQYKVKDFADNESSRQCMDQ